MTADQIAKANAAFHADVSRLSLAPGFSPVSVRASSASCFNSFPTPGGSTGGALDGSPRREPWGGRKNEQATEGRKKNLCETIILSPLRGLEFSGTNPRLAPWATLYRCSAATDRILKP